MSATALERITTALEVHGSRVVRTGGQVMAQCPAHEDANPSLSLRATETRARVHCFAGCEDRAVLDALGLGVVDLYNDPREHKNPRGPELARYVYTDASGAATRTVHRGVGKRFRQSGATRTTPGLYRLPRVIEAVAAGRRVYLVEGEEDVHAVEAAGEVATTAPQGAGSFAKVDVSPLAGARVIAVPDLDGAGATWLMLVRQRLRGVAAEVQVRAPLAGKDVDDHLAHGHDLDALAVVDEPAPATASVTPAPTPAGVTKYESDEVDERTNQGPPTPHPAMWHGPIGAGVRALAPTTEAHPVAVLVQVLAMIGAFVGDDPYVLVGGSRHHARVWPLVMGATSRGRKGESRAVAGKFVSSVTSSDSYFVDKGMTSGLSSGEGLLAALSGTDDATPDPRLVVTETEFARVLSVGGREGNTLLTILRELWDAGRARTMTRAAPLRVERAHLVVIGHVSPRELRLRLSEADVSGGTLNRFLPVLVERPRLLPDPPPAPDLSAITEPLAACLAQVRAAGEVHITLTAEARRLWARIYRALDAADTGGLLSEVLARSPAQVQRLALIYALAQASPVITPAHLRAALAVVVYCSDSCRTVFGDSAGTGDLGKLSEALRQRQRMNLSEVSTLFARNRTAAAIHALVAELVADGHASTEEEKHDKGRPTTWVRWSGPAHGRDRLRAILDEPGHQGTLAVLTGQDVA